MASIKHSALCALTEYHHFRFFAFTGPASHYRHAVPPISSSFARYEYAPPSLHINVQSLSIHINQTNGILQLNVNHKFCVFKCDWRSRKKKWRWKTRWKICAKNTFKFKLGVDLLLCYVWYVLLTVWTRPLAAWRASAQSRNKLINGLMSDQC